MARQRIAFSLSLAYARTRSLCIATGPRRDQALKPREPATTTFIFDSEIVAMDPESGHIMTFQALSQRPRKARWLAPPPSFSTSPLHPPLPGLFSFCSPIFCELLCPPHLPRCRGFGLADPG